MNVTSCYISSIAFDSLFVFLSQPEDLPDLVDPDSSDTSRNNSDDECMPGLVDMESSEDSDDSDNNESEVRI